MVDTDLEDSDGIIRGTTVWIHSQGGYAVVQTQPVASSEGAAAHVLQSAADAPAGTRLRVRLADGTLMATSDGLEAG